MRENLGMLRVGEYPLPPELGHGWLANFPVAPRCMAERRKADKGLQPEPLHTRISHREALPKCATPSCLSSWRL